MQDTGTVTFFLYFSREEHAGQAWEALASSGCSPQEIVPPEDPADETWSLAAEQELHRDDVEAALTRVRVIAVAASGELDGIATPWPDHPVAFPPRQRNR